MNKKKIVSLLLSLALTAAMAAPALAAEETTAPAPWYAAAQSYVTEKGYMTGTPNGFEPNGLVTRATVYQTLWNMAGKPESTGDATFTDVAGKWYAASANWAAATGLSTGTGSGAYDGDRAITRAELAMALYRYAGIKLQDLTAVGYVDLSTYPDAGDVAIWALPGYQWACAGGLITGKSDGRLAPLDTATRAELATVLMRFDGVEDAPAATQGTVEGKPAVISKYGNVYLDVTGEAFAAAGFEVGDMVQITVGDKKIAVQAPYGTGYSNVDQGSEIVMVGDGYVQLAINRGDFATTYGLGTKGEDGAYVLADVTVGLTIAEKGGYLQEMELRAIDDKRTNDRADYASDEVFANFRAVSVGNVAAGRLYRGSSPVNPELGRNTYADALIKKAGVKAVLNLADDEETMKGYEGYADSYYATIAVKPLNMGVDVAAADFNAKLKEGLVWLSEQEGPYYIHCTEGKDRAGFVVALLEMLSGATLRDVVSDYMLSFENYYFVKADTEQWSYIAQSNIEKSILDITGAEDIFAAGDMDLAKAAEDYLTATVGLSAEQVTALKDALTK